ncbi:MAG: CRISPR system precrRNA processing endoribonuclease RAMP protein Cas6 [Thiofilum sp.]|uniref:CRISPR system precrRNA processing endoribonuclease RAMP protein Cas6 n=1 Tax=Thiofilum sp. TaxID=2212733 RepID=UPI0025F283F7|nr:CRISPR system precrRNA processing endoribonuclease RAMP protein Cas6 [Thiofilum sp.]MBK8455487.1 CRISPR system precrRNA processing endoribonuclease RAMP protein Cas6 [Thiofilum sp.]
MVFQLDVQRYQLEYVAQTEGQFPHYAGSMWRGAWGHALKRTVCITRLPQCEHCLLRGQCVYSQLFETPAGREPLLGKINHAPHPYSIHPLATSGASFSQGALLTIGLTLIGHAHQQLSYLLYAFEQLGRHGLGKAQARLQLHAVYQESALGEQDWQLIYQPDMSLKALPPSELLIPSAPSRVQLTWLTPYRAQYQERLLKPAHFTPDVLVMGLVRRISLLAAYWGQAWSGMDELIPALQQAASTLRLEQSTLYWQAWSRFSNRQQRLVQMDGMMGSVVLSGEGLTTVWPWLWFGQWVQVGKGTVMGLGAYRLEAV